MTEPPADQPLSYEQARDELIQLVQRLETGGAPLDESLALWERGEQLAAICQAWLDGAKARVEAARSASTEAPTDARPEPAPRRFPTVSMEMAVFGWMAVLVPAVVVTLFPTDPSGVFAATCPAAAGARTGDRT